MTTEPRYITETLSAITGKNPHDRQALIDLLDRLNLDVPQARQTLKTIREGVRAYSKADDACDVLEQFLEAF